MSQFKTMLAAARPMLGNLVVRGVNLSLDTGELKLDAVVPLDEAASNFWRAVSQHAQTSLSFSRMPIQISRTTYAELRRALHAVGRERTHGPSDDEVLCVGEERFVVCDADYAPAPTKPEPRTALNFSYAGEGGAWLGDPQARTDDGWLT